jgi:RHS repeat-associated protein
MTFLGIPQKSASLVLQTTFRICLLLLCIIFLLPLVLHAQNYLTMTGITGSSAPYPAEMGTVDAANGDLHLEIPLGSFPQRGGAAPLVPKLVYDSHIWTVPTDGASAVWTTTGQLFMLPSGMSGLAFGTWGFDDGGLNGPFLMAVDANNFCDQDAMFWGQSGEQHYFNIPGTANGDQCSGGTAYATDSSGVQIRQTSFTCSGVCDNLGNDLSLYAPDGTELWGGNLFPNGIAAEDANGNYLGLTYSSPNYSTLLPPGVANPIIDSLGRTVVNSSSSGNTTTLSVMNAQGETSNYVITTTTIAVNTVFNESGVTECNNCTAEVISSIALPDGTSYSFLYDCYTGTDNPVCNSPANDNTGYYGTVTSMTVPSGATITYTYDNFTDSRKAVGRWLTSKCSSAGCWYYTPTAGTNTSEQVTVERPDSSSDVISLTIDGSGSVWPTQVQSYSSLPTSSTLLSTVNNTWDFSIPCTTLLCDDLFFTGCVNPEFSCYPHQDIRKLSSTTTLPIPAGNITKQTSYTYDTPQTANITSIREWKYQNGSNPTFSAVPDRATYMAYATIGTNNNINRPTSITVCNNVGSSDSNCGVGGSIVGGTTVARTTITYDGYGSNGSLALDSVTGIANHDDTNFGVSYTARGNPTQISQWVSGSTTSSSSYVTTVLSYDTTGQVIQSQDPKGNVTTYSYADVYYTDDGDDPPQTYTPTKPTNASVTSVKDAIGTTSTAYYFGTGQVALATDYDSITTYSHYLDPFNRPTDTDYPIGWVLNQYSLPIQGQTELDSYTPVADTGSASASCTTCSHSRAVLDSFGRTVTQNLVNNPAGEIYVNYGYDTLNRVISTSHPNFGSSDPNDVVETQQYDGLGRVVLLTHPDGELSQIAYGPTVANLGGITTQQSSAATFGYGYPVASLDEAGKQKEEWLDGFGHVIEVDEPSASTSTPGSGTVTINLDSTELSATYNPCAPNEVCWTTVYNAGSVSITVNGFTVSTSYTGGPEASTTEGIATSLASGFNVSTSPVTAVVSGGNITFTAVTGGTSTNYSFSTSSSYSQVGCPTDPCFDASAFYPSPATGALSGGTGGLSGSPLYTSYTYDALGNLTSVSQGAQSRSWTYDGLSRLTQEVTPEGGTITLSYVTSSGALCSGNPSNPCARTAPAPNQTGTSTVTTTYTYDTADRLKEKSYSDNSTTVTYAYRTSAYGKGLLSSMTDPSGSETYVYDKMKRIDSITKKIGTTSYVTSFAYNTASQLTKITYPSGRIVYYNYDAVGHLCQVATTSSASTCGAATSYLNLPSSQYDAAGRPLSATYGNGIVATVAYSPLTFELTSLSYAKGSTSLFGLNYYYQQNSSSCPTGNAIGNDGQIQCVADSVQPGRSVAYTYDALGRLLTAKTTGSTAYPQWGMSETYDRYGNRSAQTATAGTVPQPSFTINPANNQITTFTYDSAGNVIGTPSPTDTYAYDHEECNTGYTGGGSTATYTCDGNEMRVEKVVTGTDAVTTVYVRLGGQVIAEYDNGAAVDSPTREYLYSNNLLATITGSTSGSGGTIIYQHRDHLSPRFYTDVNGNCIGDRGTFPFGEAWYSNNDANCTTTATSNWIYTSYERDDESGNDYALARSYANTEGRFMSPDPLEGIVGDPQSWNRYAYVENDPINLSDPSGQGFWEDLGFAIADIFIAIFDPGALVPVLNAEGDAAGVLVPSWWYAAIIDGEITWVAWYGKGQPPPGAVPAANPDGTMPGGSGSADSTSSSSAPQGGGTSAGSAQDNGASGQGPGSAGGDDTLPAYRDPFHSSVYCPNCGGIWQESQDFVYDFMKNEAIQAAGGLVFEAASTVRLAPKIVNEGIYEFTAKTGETYVGQSGNISARLTQHLASGKLPYENLDTVRTTEVLGGKLMREIAEQLRINELGGIGNLANIRNPIGNGAAPLLRALTLEF